MLQPVALHDSHKKVLRQVLRIFDRIAASADKEENGPPIRTTKLSERIARLLLFTSQMGGRKDQAPAGSHKLARLVSALGAVLPVHKSTLLCSHLHTSAKS
jgi:hypothetical protein